MTIIIIIKYTMTIYIYMCVCVCVCVCVSRYENEQINKWITRYKYATRIYKENMQAT